MIIEITIHIKAGSDINGRDNRLKKAISIGQFSMIIIAILGLVFVAIFAPFDRWILAFHILAFSFLIMFILMALANLVLVYQVC